MMSEKREQKFPNGDMSLNPDMASASDWLCCKGNLLQPIIIRNTTRIWIVIRQTSSWKFCAISLSRFAGKPEGWHCEMSTVFLGYPFISISALIGKILDVLHDK